MVKNEQIDLTVEVLQGAERLVLFHYIILLRFFLTIVLTRDKEVKSEEGVVVRVEIAHNHGAINETVTNTAGDEASQ